MNLDVSRLYGNAELEERLSRYRPSLVGIWEEDFLSRLTPDERRRAANATLNLPLLGPTHQPLEFYSNPAGQQVFLPIASIKFIDDLSVAYAYYEKMGCDLGTISDYAAALRFQPEKAAGSPLDALGVPPNAINEPYVDDLAQKLLKSIVYFVAVHEYAHVMYRHGGYQTVTAEQAQLHESEADAFALQIMCRIGVAPLGVTFFFLLASRLEASPGDFASLVEYETYLRQQATHPVSAQRILKLAEAIETHADDFARLQRDPAAWKGQLQREAQELRVIANGLDDRKMRQFLAERARNADFAVFRRACITRPQAGTAEVYRPLIDDLENLERAMGPLAKLNADPNRTQSVVLAQLHIVEAAIAPISEARKRVSILGDASTRKDLDGICTALEVMKQLAEHTQTGEGATALAATLLEENGMIKKIRERLLARI